MKLIGNVDIDIFTLKNTDLQFSFWPRLYFELQMSWLGCFIHIAELNYHTMHSKCMTVIINSF